MGGRAYDALVAGAADGTPRRRRGRYPVNEEPSNGTRHEYDEPTQRPRFEPPPAAPAPAASTSTVGDTGDPEQALATVRISLDPNTLHEIPENVYELFRIRDSLTQKIDASSDNASRARLSVFGRGRPVPRRAAGRVR